MNTLLTDIVAARQLINQIEILASNAHVNGRKPIYDKVQELQTHVQLLLLKTADYA